MRKINLMNLKQKIEEEKTKLKNLENISEEFPDLKEVGLRFRTVYVSSLVNKIVEDVGFNHSCGCCDDASLYAMPFVKRGDIIIYSDPPQIYIGHLNPWHSRYDDEEDITYNEYKFVIDETKFESFNKIVLEKIQEFTKKYPASDD